MVKVGKNTWKITGRCSSSSYHHQTIIAKCSFLYADPTKELKNDVVCPINSNQSVHGSQSWHYNRDSSTVSRRERQSCSLG